jgi:hypothetical protein
MNHPFCPNPIVVQRLCSGPLGAHIDTWAQQLLTQGYASWTAKYTMRLLANLSCWLQRQTLTAADLNDRRVDEFLQDRYQCYRAHRDDRPILSRLLEHLRDQGLIPVRVVETRTGPHDRIASDFQHYLLQQRGLAPSTVQASPENWRNNAKLRIISPILRGSLQDYLNTVRRFLSARFGAQPLRTVSAFVVG